MCLSHISCFFLPHTVTSLFCFFHHATTTATTTSTFARLPPTHETHERTALSNILHTPLRLHACAHTQMHTQRLHTIVTHERHHHVCTPHTQHGGTPTHFVPTLFRLPQPLIHAHATLALSRHALARVHTLGHHTGSSRPHNGTRTTCTRFLIRLSRTTCAHTHTQRKHHTGSSFTHGLTHTQTVLRMTYVACPHTLIRPHSPHAHARPHTPFPPSHAVPTLTRHALAHSTTHVPAHAMRSPAMFSHARPRTPSSV